MLPEHPCSTGPQCYTIERVFEIRGEAPTVRRFTPPRRVIVDMIAATGWAFPLVGHRPVTLGERAFGLRVEHFQEGRQLAWLLSCRGVWMAAVEVEIMSSNSAVAVTSGLVVPETAIRPVQEHFR